MFRRLKQTDLSVPLSRTEQFAIMVIRALDDLWEAPCCTDCCPQCAVLANLLVTGELDHIVQQAPREMLWDIAWFPGGRVSRTWLYGQWAPGAPTCVCSEQQPFITRKPGKACARHRKVRKKCTCQDGPDMMKNPAQFLAA